MLVENLSLAASCCSNLMLSGCAAFRINFDDSGEAEDVESMAIADIKCTRSVAVHHNEDSVAANLNLILIEEHGQALDDESLVSGVLSGLNKYYSLEDTTMRFHGWLCHDGAV